MSFRAMSLFVALVGSVLSGSNAVAQSREAWIMRAGETGLMKFDVRRTARGCNATWSQPTDYRTDGETFRFVKGPLARRTAIRARCSSKIVELAFASPFKGGRPDLISLTKRSSYQASMEWSAYGGFSYLLSRTSMAAPLGNWEDDRRYAPKMLWPTNAELTSMFLEDQRARQDIKNIDWPTLRNADAKRRARTDFLLKSSGVKSGDDFFHAAYIFQHGYAASDYLEAHALAMTAIARGRGDAAWIAAATLDRYLQTIGQKQIYGTQFLQSGDHYTQEPYDRGFLPDIVRRAVGVPPLADQADELKKWDKLIKRQ